jgi:hypothetical protein
MALIPIGLSSIPPFIKPGSADSHKTAEPTHGNLILMLLHKRRFHVELLAKKTVAFFKRSRSIRRVKFS